MSKEFLPSQGQQKVLDSKNKNLIVSASAGTGKTTVMVERIARAVQNKEVTIKELLVVTFTEAAAFEMKKKLVKKLSSSGDEKVLSQLSEIDNCSISTLHSFCAKIVRRYFVTADIDPAFKVLAGNEWEMAVAKSLGEVFDDYYESGDDDFLQLVEIYGTSRRDDEFKQVIKNLYSFKVCKVDFDNWFKGTLKLYEVENDENEFCRLQNNLIVSQISDLQERFDSVAQMAVMLNLDKLTEYAAKQSQKIYVSKNKDLAGNMMEICAFEGFDSIYERFLGKEPSIEATTLFQTCKSLKEEASKQFKVLQKFFENDDYSELLQDTVESSKRIGKLIEVVDRVQQNFEAHKKRNALLDFNDLEHKTLIVLAEEKNREKIRSDFKFVYVDEYQDINEVQEAIISLIKRENNLFLVGDVKQSIYSFRQCDPDIFVKKMVAFDEDESRNQLEFLNDNFRSDTEILHFANVVFGKIMVANFGGVDYEVTSQLVGSQKSKGLLPAVSFDIVRAEKPKPEGIQGIYSLHSEPNEVHSLAEFEARQICKRYREVLGLAVSENGTVKTIRPADIVILVRNMTGYTKKLIRELEKLGVPLMCNSKKELFGGTEIRTILNLFQVLDNPKQDIPLAGALLGIFGKLNENDLAEIKLFSEGDLWQRCDAYRLGRQNEVTAKLNDFFVFVEKMRFLSQSMTVSRLVAKIFAETGFNFFTLGLPSGKLRLSKLNEFVASLVGKKYDESIAEFLKFVHDSADIPTEIESTPSNDAVRVMTIHKSKGLEFPVVFVAGCGNSFNLRTDKIVCDKDFGIGVKCFDFETRTERETLSHNFIVKMAKNRMVQEEMRVLYVAITRAKSHLFLTATASHTEKSVFSAKDCDCFAEWLALGIGFDESVCRVSNIDAESLLERGEKSSQREFAFSSKNETAVDKVKSEMNFHYPHADACKLEMKAVSSKLQPIFKPQEEAEIDISQKVVEESSTPKNLIGTAYHKIFEMLDFSVTSIFEVEQLLCRLVEEGQVDQDTASELNCQIVFDVTKLDIFKDLTKRKVYRELPFMMKTKYNSLFDDKTIDEQIFLQGVIDMLIVDGDSADIIDFKYTSRSTWLKSRYEKQLNSYADAVTQILKVKNVKKYIVSILDGKVIEIV